MKDVKEEKEDEAKEKDRKEEEEEEIDPVRIVAQVIASLPHSPPKSIVSSMEIASTSVIATIIDTSSTQSLFSPSQL